MTYYVSTWMLNTTHSLCSLYSLDLWKVFCDLVMYYKITNHSYSVQSGIFDWHELMIPQRIMRPFIAGIDGQLDPRCS